MGERSAYVPGTFCWADLGTTDTDAARVFYGALLGWTGEDMPVGDAFTYTMMRLHGHDVAGMYAQPAEDGAAGVPPAWMSYVSVEDADATASRAESLGGAVVAAAMDVMDSGRLAILRDPQGAYLGLWQPRAHIGARLVNDPGAMCLNQLNTSDPDTAARFYTALFGWDVTRVADDPVPYWGIYNRGSLNGGMMALPPGVPAPPHWLVYFTAADGLESATATIGTAGGQVMVPVTPVPGGRFLVARDPQGAHLGLLEGNMDA